MLSYLCWKDEGQLKDLQKDFMRQNEHLKGRCKCSSIHIKLNYKRRKNNPRITDKALGPRLIAVQQNQDLVYTDTSRKISVHWLLEVKKSHKEKK